MLKIHYKIDETVEIDHKVYELDLAFDVVLRTFDLFNDKLMDKFSRIQVSYLTLFKDKEILNKLEDYTIDERLEIITAILEDLTEKEEQDKHVERDILGNPIRKEYQDNRKLMDWNEDSELIYSAFMQAYNIDLIEEQGRLNWFKFKALLNCLPSDTEFMQVVRIRGWNEDEDKKEYKEQMREAQKRLSLD